MNDVDLMLDGNAVGGLLHEIFAFDMTMARATCAGCGATGPVGALPAYTQAPGAILRCRACSQVLIRIVHGRDRYWLDLGGLRCLEITPAA